MTRAVGDHPFVRVVRVRGVAPLVSFWLVSFLTIGMTPLAVILLLRHNQFDYTTAGVVLAAYAAGMALAAPVAGRLIDRLGARAVLLPCSLVLTASFAALAVLAAHHAPEIALGAAAVVAGSAFPRASAVLHALWPSVMPTAELRDSAYVMDSTLAEIAPMAGALLVVVLADGLSPAAALLTAAGCNLIGTVGFVGSPLMRRPQGERSARSRDGGLLRTAGFRALLIACASLGGIAGAIDVGAPAFAEAHGARSAAGFALSACALGSLVGGLLFASRWRDLTLLSRYRRALLALLAGFALPLLASSNAELVAGFLVAGVPFAVAFGAATSLVGVITPDGARTEAFANLSAAMTLGGALGYAIGGLVERAGPLASLGLATCFAAIALCTTAPRLQRQYERLAALQQT